MRYARTLLFPLLALSLVFAATALIRTQAHIPANPTTTAETPPSVALQLRETYGKLPLYFIQNRGQFDHRVAYYIQGGNKTIYFTPEGVTYALASESVKEESERESSIFSASFDRPDASPDPDLQAQRWVLKLDFVGANPAVRPAGRERTQAVVSYFKGPKEEWDTGLPTYNEIVYRDLWPGVDLVYSGTSSRLKYTFLIHPGADPDQIKLAYRGATEVRINDSGQLEVSTPLETFQEDKPYVYQEVEGQRVEVEAAYTLENEMSDGMQFGFSVGDYDRNKMLVLDPVVILYAGYIGGSGSDRGWGIAVDSAGAAYIVGTTSSTDATFPVVVGPDLTFHGTPGSDAFVAKVNPPGTALVYAGYIGGSGADEGRSIAVDSSGNAYITGETFSNQSISISFPATVGPDLTFNGGWDAFVAKVNPSGTALVYSGYIGGSNTDFGRGIALDSLGNAYVTGLTQSTESTFPVAVGPDLTFNGGTIDVDAFVVKVNASGTALVYAGYIGGSDSDRGFAIAVDSSGSAYVSGETRSTEATFPVTVGPDLSFNGDVDAFVVKVNASGTALVYAGYIGGSLYDSSEGIAVDSTGNAYVAGSTQSTEASFPVTVGPDLTFNGGNFDAFVAKVNASGTALVYAGYIGGSDLDSGYGIAVDSAGSAYVTGSTRSGEATFPATVGPDLTFNGIQDAFVAKVNPPGTSLLYAGYIGGSSTDSGTTGIAVDSMGAAYITGNTNSAEDNFPVQVGPDLTFNGSAFDAFAVKLGEPLPPTPILPPSSAVNGASFRAATEPGGALASGSIVSLFGTNLAMGIRTADSVPLPTTLLDSRVTFNGIAAPLFSVAGSQINAQVPFELQPGQVSVQVARAGETSALQTATVAAVSPGIFALSQQGSGQGAILISNTAILAAPAGSVPGREARPANRLEFVSIFCTGLGDVTNRPPSGAPPAGPALSVTLQTPTVTIGGVEAPVSFSGLTSFVGLYQVNVQVPSTAPTGDAVPVVLTIGGVTSNTVTIAVR